MLGQDAALESLTAAARSGRLHHAWLLQGPRGIGKASLAFDFARRLLGARVGEALADDVPEDVFRQVAQGGHPNLVHITRPAAERGGGFRTQITVDGIRRLNHFFQTTAGGRWRVAIIDPADDMNRNAANALLKILEEPPERSIFLLVNHQPGRLLPTIRSRCRVLRMESLAPDTIVDILAERVGSADPASIRGAAEHSGGSARTAYLMLLAGGLEVAAEVERLYRGAPDWIAIQKLGDALTMKGREAAYDLMTADLFRLLAAEAETLQARGEVRAAADRAAFWQTEQTRWREAALFNLDRKQVILTFFTGLARLRAENGHAA